MTQHRSLPRLIRKLQDALGDQICVALDDPSVVEIMLNPDGKLFIERLGHGITPAGDMRPGSAEIVIGSVAHVLDSEVDDAHPIVSGELPIGGHRFEGLLPPVVSAPSFMIRRRASQLIPLDAYVAKKVMTANQAEIIRSAVKSRLNIVVSGGTGSGLPMPSSPRSSSTPPKTAWSFSKTQLRSSALRSIRWRCIPATRSTWRVF
jgi:type IV secretion system protein VirB11